MALLVLLPVAFVLLYAKASMLIMVLPLPSGLLPVPVPLVLQLYTNAVWRSYFNRLSGMINQDDAGLICLHT